MNIEHGNDIEDPEKANKGQDNQGSSGKSDDKDGANKKTSHDQKVPSPPKAATPPKVPEVPGTIMFESPRTPPPPLAEIEKKKGAPDLKAISSDSNHVH